MVSERVQQRTAEHIEDAPQYPVAQSVGIPVLPVTEEIMNETAEMVRLVPHEQVQQGTAEKIVDEPQFVEETVELVRLVPQERVQWIDRQMMEVFSSKEELLTQTHELKMQLDEISKKTDALRAQKSRARPEIALRRVVGSIHVSF